MVKVYFQGSKLGIRNPDSYRDVHIRSSQSLIRKFVQIRNSLML